MKTIRLTRKEKRINDVFNRGEYVSVGKREFNKIARMLEARKKKIALKIRINNGDLQNLKRKAAMRGVKYKAFIVEALHRAAMS